MLWGFSDRNGRVVIPARFKESKIISDSMLLGYNVDDDLHSYVYNHQGKLLGVYDGPPRMFFLSNKDTNRRRGLWLFEKYPSPLFSNGRKAGFEGPPLTYLYNEDGHFHLDSSGYYIPSQNMGRYLPVGKSSGAKVLWGLLDSNGVMVEPIAFAGFYSIGNSYLKIKDSENALYASLGNGPFRKWPIRNVDTIREMIADGFFLIKDKEQKHQALMRYDGKLVYVAKGTEKIDRLPNSGDLFVVESYKDGKELKGVIDADGNQILPTDFEHIRQANEYFLLVRSKSDGPSGYSFNSVFDLRSNSFVFTSTTDSRVSYIIDTFVAQIEKKDTVELFNLETKMGSSYLRAHVQFHTTNNGIYVYDKVKRTLEHVRLPFRRINDLLLEPLNVNLARIRKGGLQGIFDLALLQTTLPASYDSVFLARLNYVCALKGREVSVFSAKGSHIYSGKWPIRVVSTFTDYLIIETDKEALIMEGNGHKIETVPKGSSYHFSETGYALISYSGHSLAVRLVDGKVIKVPAVLKLNDNAPTNKYIKYLVASKGSTYSLFDKKEFAQAIPDQPSDPNYSYTFSGTPGLFLVQYQYERNKWTSKGLMSCTGFRYWED